MKDPKVTDAVKVPAFVFCAARNETAEAALRHMRTHSINHLVVVDKGRVLGVVSDRDIFLRAELNGDALWLDGLEVGDVMQAVEHGLSSEATLREAVALMWENSCSALPIVAGAELIGIITETDVVRVLAKLSRREPKFQDPVDRLNVALSNVVVQSAMQLLGEAGI